MIPVDLGSVLQDIAADARRSRLLAEAIAAALTCHRCNGVGKVLNFIPYHLERQGVTGPEWLECECRVAVRQLLEQQATR